MFFGTSGQDKGPAGLQRLPIRADTLLIGLVAVLLSTAMLRFETFERLHAFTKRYEWMELDELLMVALVGSAAVAILATRRRMQLQTEVRIRQEAERQAIRLARFDPLTGLANRRQLIEHLDRARGRGRRTGAAIAVLLIDLDRFKPINDFHGHRAGDDVLVELANRFQSVAQGDGRTLVARMGGDEFAAVIECDCDADAPTLLAERLKSLARLPILTGGTSVETGVSIGIAVDDRQVIDTADLISRADHAMYRAKQSGGNAVRLFDADMDAQAQSRSRLEAELRTAIRAGQIIPFFQPIVRVSDGGIAAFECLARWDHPVRGLMRADRFIEAAERSEQIDALSFPLLEQACAIARQWPDPVSLTFNLSPMQLRDGTLTDRILQCLARTGLAPDRLIIEITESGLFPDFEVARATIQSLKDAGIKLALDDFGTGYSSLSHLRDLPFDIIKIDRSFVETVDIARHASIVTAIIGMGHNLGMQVIAEGVTCAPNMRALASLNCDFAQGYMLGHPVGAEDSLRMVLGGSPGVMSLRLAASS